MTIEDEIFNQLVKYDILKYVEADMPHECTMCGEVTSPTYKLDDEEHEGLDNEAPYLYICSMCYAQALAELEER